MTQVDIPLIDIHTHIGTLPGAVGDIYYAEDLIHIAEHEGVRFMLASSASVTTIGRAYGMAQAIDMVQRYGSRLGGMLWINPHDPSWRDDVAPAVQNGFYGIKIHPALDNYMVTREALDDIFACAREHRWPILTHTGEDHTPTSALCYGPLIEAYPDVILILAHLRLEAIPLAKRHENVYVDTTYMDPARVELGVDALGASKILFGSDACEGFDVGRVPGRVRPRRSYASLIQGLRERGIAETALETICYHNARTVFGIDR